MKAIIFGINGQDGFYLARLLEKEGVDVTGISRDDADLSILNLKGIKQRFDKDKPDYVFHLAANSTTKHEALFDNHDTISTGTLNILEAVRCVSPHSKVFISGSGLQFRNTGSPISESDEFEARDAYSVSRIHSTFAARYYRSLGVKAYVGFFFNHDSPRRSARHISRYIADVARSASKGGRSMIEIGDASVEKEWAFAEDVVEAVWTLIKQDDVYEAVLGTGLAYSIQEYIEACFSVIGKNWSDYVTKKNDFKAEYHRLVSDPSTIFSLGWRPKTDFRQLVKIMLRDG